MNKKIITSLFIATALITGCAEEYPGTELAVSFPAIELQGDEFVTVMQGSAFEDAGATATFGSTDVSSEIEVESDVDEDVPGLYTVTYSIAQTNEINEESVRTTRRLVAVVSADAAAADLSGSYHRASNGRISTVSKLAPGFYFMTDCWGTATSAGAPLAVNTYLVNTTGTSLVFRYDVAGAPFGGNQGTGTVMPNGDLSLTVTLIGAAATRTNVWIND
jgi:hypothetical protein